jgi:hypothetical protein
MKLAQQEEMKEKQRLQKEGCDPEGGGNDEVELGEGDAEGDAEAFESDGAGMAIDIDS